MATKKPFIARHGINVGSTVVFGSNGKLHANNVISNGTITDDMLSGSTGSNLSKVQQVESNLLSTNTAIRALTSANDTKISQVESNLLASNTAIRSYVDTEVAAVVNSAPETLNTLNELAAALGDDANFATTVTTNLGQKLGSTATVTLTGDVTASATAFSANAVSVATSIASNVVGASELNVSGNGTSGQYLASDGDGTMTWSDIPAGYADSDVDDHLSGGTGVTYSSGTISIGQAVATSSDVRFDSFGVGTAASGTTGQIRATNSIVAHYSDDRLKSRQGNIENAVEKVMSLNGFYYTENETAKSLGYDNDDVQVGVSAQEVEAILPEIIEDAPINANFEGADYKTLMYDKLVPLLVEAIKEQQNQINELKDIINNQ